MHLDTGHRLNNFDALRIAAALMVLFGHAYVLTGREALEPAIRLTGRSFGEIGVAIFFVISGFLVSASWRRLPQPRAFLAARLLRILPGLAVAVASTALVLGPLASTLPPERYFAEPETWLYPIRNLLLYPVAYSLPGVFETLPYPDVVNGSLWTLRLEFSLYLAVPALWAVARRGRLVPVLAAAAAALLFLGCVAAGSATPPVVLIGARYLFLFLAGAALSASGPARWRQGWSAVAFWGVLAAFAFASPAWSLAASTLVLPLLVVSFALTPLRGLSSLSRWGDYSYGIYIYAFPVQQALVQAFGPDISIAAFTALTLLCTTPLAVLSWLLVEKPALDLKPRFRRGPSGVAAETAGPTPGSPPRPVA
jgi:peptidoglycan/LPS O-acetylase OafA/YrhL